MTSQASENQKFRLQLNRPENGRFNNRVYGLCEEAWSSRNDVTGCSNNGSGMHVITHCRWEMWVIHNMFPVASRSVAFCPVSGRMYSQSKTETRKTGRPMSRNDQVLSQCKSSRLSL